LHMSDTTNNRIQDGAQDILGASAAAMLYPGLLRDLYTKMDLAIYNEANEMIRKGLNNSDVAEWANKARNQAKIVIRNFGFDHSRLEFEKRNLELYLNKVGPTYEQLKNGWTDVKGKWHPPKNDMAIIQSAGKSNIEYNKKAYKFKIAGGIFILFDIGAAGYKVYEEKVNRPRVLLEEAGAIAGSMAVGLGAAKTCGFVGGFLAGPPGAIVGSLGCGLGGAIYGGIWGRDFGQLLANKLYPVEETVIEVLP
jgi:hypothetical protein